MSEQSSRRNSDEKSNHRPIGFVRSRNSHKTGSAPMVLNKDGSLRGLRGSRNGTSSTIGSKSLVNSTSSKLSSGDPGKEEEQVGEEEVESISSSQDHEDEDEGDTQTEEGLENTTKSVRFTEDTNFTTKSTYIRNKKRTSRTGGSSKVGQGSMKTLNFLSGRAHV